MTPRKKRQVALDPIVRAFRVEELERRRLLTTGTIVPLSAFTETSYQSRDLAPFTVSPQVVGAGGTITITFGAADPVSIDCSDALITGATLDGAPVIATNGSLDLYDYDVPVPDPDAGAIISVPTAGSHVATFEIDPTAATENITDEDYVNGNGNTDSGNLYAYDGPWITGVSDDGSYSSAQPFNIVGNTDTLSFLQQPSNTAAGDTIKPPVTVAVQNSGVTDTTNTDSITLSLVSGNGTLAGTVTEPAVAGVATFSNLSINDGGTYTLTASDGSMTPVLSSAFDISAGKLVFTKLPQDGSAGQALNPAVTVSLEDGSGKIITADSSSVVTLNPIGLTGNAPITGNTATLVNGVATFSNVQLTKPGFYQLQATDGGDAAATSGKIKIAGDHLEFLKQPANNDVNTAIPLTVALKDTKNNLVTDATSTVVLSLNTVTGGANAVLSGTVMLSFVNGLASFSTTTGPMVNVTGTFTLTATEEDYTTGALAPTNTTTAATSKAFGVAGLHLVVKKQPTASVDALAAIPVTFDLEDSHGKRDTSENAAQVQLSLNTVAGGTGATLGGVTLVTFVGGVATFTSEAGPAINGVGTFTLSASEINTADPASSVVTHSLEVLGFKLKQVASTREPIVASNNDLDTSSLGSYQDFAVYDSKGKAVTSTTGLPMLDLSLVSGNGNITIGQTPTAPTDLLHTEIVQNRYTVPFSLGTTQANYIFRFSFTMAGDYTIKLSSVQTTTATAPTNLFEDFSENCVAVNPVLYANITGTDVATANKPVDLSATLIRQKNDRPAAEESGVITLASVGFMITVGSSSTSGAVSGSPSAAFATVDQTTQVGGITAYYPASIGIVMLSFTEQGTYQLVATEMASPGGGAFDPATAVPVPTTSPITFGIRVKPDKLVVVQQLAPKIEAGQTFSFAVALEDDQGDILTTQSPALDGTIDAVLTAPSTKGGDGLNGIAPIDFENGYASFSNLMITTPGIYRLQVSADYLHSGNEQNPDPLGLTAKSDVFRIVAAI